MKIIDGDALCIEIRKTADKRRDSSLQILAGLVTGFVHDMPEAEAYTESRQRIENMEKVIEDLEERVAIMSEHGLIPVKVRQPNDNKVHYVIGKNDEGYEIYAASYEDGKWGYDQDYYDKETWGWTGSERFEVDNVVYWFDLPEPPKEGEA